MMTGTVPYRTLRIVKNAREQRGLDVARVSYLLDYNEMWARSYAQYIALRSEKPLLLRQLSPVSALPVSLHQLLQWESDDFVPILDAIDALFRRKGWRP